MTFLRVLAGMTAGLAVMFVSAPLDAQTREKCVIARSHYTTWELLEYVKTSGILKKWGDKYHVDLDTTPPMDYVASMDQFKAGKFCAVTVTNMDALAVPASGTDGIDMTFLVVMDYSNDNDGILGKSDKKLGLKDLVGNKVTLVKDTVSHYLLWRGLTMRDIPMSQVRIVNALSESDVRRAFETGGDNTFVVTWNPTLMAGRQMKGAQMLFGSSQTPGEIIDGIIVPTGASNSIKKAITGAWFEAARVLSEVGSPQYKEAIKQMAKSAENTEQEVLAQLKTTHLFFKAHDALVFTRDAQLKGTMSLVRRFCSEVSEDKSALGVTVRFPDGSMIGYADNVRNLRFDTIYMQMAADGTL